jgi:hypothetical protein
MAGYPDISDRGPIGDPQTAALDACRMTIAPSGPLLDVAEPGQPVLAHR